MDENWLAVELQLGDGLSIRFGPDEGDPDRVPRSIEYSTQMPGGFGTGSFILSRPPNLRADDAQLFASVRVYSAGGRTMYEGRVVGVPQVASEEVRIETEGWVSELDDDETFQPLIADADLSQWTNGPSPQRAIALNALYPPTETAFVAAGGDIPAVQLQLTRFLNPGAVREMAFALYRTNQPIESVYRDLVTYDGISGASPLPGGAGNWFTEILFGDTETFASQESSGNLIAGGAAYTTPTGAGREVVELHLYFTSSAPAAGYDGSWNAYYRKLVVYGRHGLTKRGTAPGGFYGSDIIAYALGGTSLNFTLGDSIEQSSTVIPHYLFREPGTRRKLVEEITGLGGAQFIPNDWGVYENREFFWRSAGSYGKTWRVRGDLNADPSSEGPESKERTAGMKVSYQTGDGRTFSVGPPGSNSDYETTDLLDTDSQNPASRLTKRIKHRTVGITNQEGAVNIARVLLEEANRVDWRGSTTIKGEVRDDAGNLYPTALVRAGDRIVAEDGDAIPHPIASTSYSQDDLSVKVDVGAPPDRSEVLLAQLLAATDLVAA